MPTDSYTPARRPALVQWFALILGLSILGVTMSINMGLEYRDTGEREQERLSVQAKVIAQNMALYLASGNQALESMMHEVPFLDMAAQISFLRSMVDAAPGIRTAGILDENGNSIASSRSEVIGMNFGNRTYFQAAKSRPDAEVLYISTPFQSVLGIYSINLSRVILGRDGKFRGLVYATLDNQYFETLMQSVLYAPDMWSATTHSDGPLFLRQPDSGKAAGVDLGQGDTLFSRHRAGNQQSSVQSGRAYGESTPQTAALYTVSAPSLNMDKSLVVAVGRDTDEVFALWWHRAMMQGALFGLIALLSMAGLYAYQRRQRVFDARTAAVRRALRAKDEDYRLIVEGTSDLVLKLDTDGRFTYANSAFCAVFGLTPGDLIGLRCQDQQALAGQCMEDTVLQQLKQPPYTVRYQQSSHAPNGTRHIDWRAQALRDEAGIVTGIVSIGHDITEHMVLTSALQEQAQRDPLTGLANRRYFLEMGHMEQARASRYGHPMSALMLDLDHFKQVNDTYGHKMGDEVLQKLSELLIANKREPDIAARWGGEEFVLLLPNTDSAAAVQIAERLRDAIAQSAVRTDAGETIRFTTSVGVAQLGGEATTLEHLLEQADRALYEAKRTGRNKVCAVTASVAGS